jgi:hypothetical protein
MRARKIKPGLFKNELLGVEDSTLTLLFIGLWCLADCEGRLEDRPLRIGAQVFPYKKVDVDALLTRLQELGFIVRDRSGEFPFITVKSLTNPCQRVK